MRNDTAIGMLGLAMAALVCAPALAGPPKDALKSCAPDAVVAGSACIDKYEASVWRVPNPTTTNAALVKKIKGGTATQANLMAGGATQLLMFGDYAPCAANGQNCANDIYAVSLPGVAPAADVTWFQAQAACADAGKRLPTNAEWQVAADGTPDPGPDNGTTDCNTTPPTITNTGARTNCKSARGAFDMVGNLWEWVAEWVPLSTACPGWDTFSNDYQCFAGADTTGTEGPGALIRGGGLYDGTSAGPLAVAGLIASSRAGDDGVRPGFRCAR